MSARTWAEICSEDPHSQAVLDAINAGGHAAQTLITALQVACRPGGVLYDDERGYLNPAVVLGLGKLISEDPVQWRAVHAYLPSVQGAARDVVGELAESDPMTSGEWSQWCVHCKEQTAFGSNAENNHQPDCLWLRARKAAGK